VKSERGELKMVGEGFMYKYEGSVAGKTHL